MLSLIAIIAKNRAIGWQNKLLYNIPEDLKHFKAITSGHAVIMGENTFHSLGDRPLPDRVNIVLTRDINFKADGCFIAYSIDQAIKIAQAQNQDEIFFIGGGQVYRQALPLADKLYLTVVDDEPAQADTYFPDYSEFKNVISQTQQQASGYKITFLELTR